MLRDSGASSDQGFPGSDPKVEAALASLQLKAHSTRPASMLRGEGEDARLPLEPVGKPTLAIRQAGDGKVYGSDFSNDWSLPLAAFVCGPASFPVRPGPELELRRLEHLLTMLDVPGIELGHDLTWGRFFSDDSRST